MAARLVMAKGRYAIWQVDNMSDNGYMVVNTQMCSHTHIKNYKTAEWLIDLSATHKVPYDIPKYLVISLIRINDNEEYLSKLNAILEKRNDNKRARYYNVNKGRIDKGRKRHEK